MLKWRGLCRIGIFIHAKWRHEYMTLDSNQLFEEAKDD